MDLYEILRIGTNATQQEIEKAYTRLLKEARYNAKINRKEVEMAFRVLGNPQQKKAYDAKLYERTKLNTIVNGFKKKREKKVLDAYEKTTHWKGIAISDRVKRLAKVAGVLILVAVIYFFVRFGYYLKEFSPGDVIYLKSNDARYGMILKQELNHRFPGAKKSEDAYLIKVGEAEYWVPDHIVKVSCYKLE